MGLVEADTLGGRRFRQVSYTGNYLVLHEELALLDKNNFRLKEILDIPIEHYYHTVSKHWLSNMTQDRERLLAINDSQHFHDFRIYFRSTLRSFRGNIFGQHIVANEKLF